MLCNLSDKFLENEFHRVKDGCYLDHTGAALYAKSQAEAMFKDLCENVYSNPHSNNLSSKLTHDTIDQVRYRILEFFNTNINEYSVIFTSGATEALKIVAETFDFTGINSALYRKEHRLEDKHVYEKCNYSGKLGEFVYTQSNHTSVLGMRAVHNVKQVSHRCLNHEQVFQIFSHGTSNIPIQEQCDGNSLFVYPAQCNFSGMKYPLTWVQDVHEGVLSKEGSSQWFCMLDAATYVSTSHLDLTSVKPDFVCISFYKMFGLPTGLGALLVRNSSAYSLNKQYYGGGTVEVALPMRSCHVLRQKLCERFEDGTINFLSIVALNHGFNNLKQLGLTMHSISIHCFTLAQYLYRNLLALRHQNGMPAVKLYCDTDYSDPDTQGGIVNFNMVNADGSYVGYAMVVHMANLHNIHLRAGCFCNPGACLRHLGLTEEQYFANFQAGHVCGDDRDLIDGRPTGSVRVSFGYYTTMKHLNRLIDMLTVCFVTSAESIQEVHNSSWKENENKLDTEVKINSKQTQKNHSEVKEKKNDIIEFEQKDVNSVANMKSLALEDERKSELVLSHIFIYPVKSCGRFTVNGSWSLDDRGLAFDRLWMIVTDTGVALTQKQEPKLCLIRPIVDLGRRLLVLTCKGQPSVSVPLDVEPSTTTIESSLCQSKVCADYIQGYDCGDVVADWLSLVINKSGLRLVRQADEQFRNSKANCDDRLSLSNQAQFLMICDGSVNWLADQVKDVNSCTKESMLDRFRSNLVVKGSTLPFEEQKWTEVHIGSVKFKVDGPCGRCQMICIDQSTGQRTREPLTTLSGALQGKLKFGIYLSQTVPCKSSKISVGDCIRVV